jgi:lysophospholipase L1-like esterase
MRVRKALLLFLIAALQFAVFEAGLRRWGHSEAAPSFETLFVPDASIGYRLRPTARTRFATDEFDTTIAINAQGVRDENDVGPKPPGERRIVVLGDSLVLSVQVDARQTFAHLLQERLNAGGGPVHYRVINAGVQGYGPVEELLFYRTIAHTFQPDLVIETIFVGNDAEEAYASQRRLLAPAAPTVATATDSLTGRLRRIVRRSLVLQVLRLRLVSATDRLTNWVSAPEPPLQSYAAIPPLRVVEGLRVSAECVRQIAEDASRDGARTMVMLMPARFQVDEADYGRLKDIVRGAGGDLVRNGATDRFADVLHPLGLPLFDALPVLRASQPGPDVFFQQTVHLTPRGHVIIADALERFLRQQGLL